MKKIFLIVLFAFTAIFSFSQGAIQSDGRLAPTGSYPITKFGETQTGLWPMTRTTERDSIPTWQRVYGMLVYCSATDSVYQLQSAGLANTWYAFKFGSVNLAGYVPTSRTLTINGVTQDLSADRTWTINTMVYPSAGIAVSTGSAWGTSITDNSSNWNTAFSWGDWSSSVALKLNISDTSSILSNRLRISDTATMLSARPLNNRFLDTATALQVRIQTKSPIAGSTSITTLGTIGTGTWQGTAIADSYISSAATWNAKQAAYANLTTIGALTNGNGFLRQNGAGVFSYDTNSYLTGNQTITLSGDISGSGATAITTSIGALKVTNAMLAGSIDYAKMNGLTVPTWNQNTTGNAATATNVAWTGVTSRPTALSAFTNDLGNYGGWITGYTETDPLIYAWAKAASKPSYSWSEIISKPTNLSSFTNDLGNYGGWITGISAAMVNAVGSITNSTSGTAAASNVVNVYAGNESTIANGFSLIGGGDLYINYRGASGVGITGYIFANGLSSGVQVPVKASSFIGAGSGLTSLPTNTALYPTLNQNTTGTASNVTGVVAIANGGTGSSTQNFVDLSSNQTKTGTLTLTNASMLFGSGRTTNYQDVFRVANTGADMLVAIEGNTGGVRYTGSTAYASIVGSASATPLEFGTTDVIRARFSAGGDFAVLNNQTIGGMLGVTGELSGTSATFSSNLLVAGNTIRLNNDNGYIQLERSTVPYSYIGTANNTTGGAATDLGIRAENNLRLGVGNNTNLLISAGGAITASSLAGIGDRVLVANSSGTLSATATLGSNAFTSTAYLPLSGGTLTGGLNGTTANFSSTTTSTSTTTGALVVSGGVGIGGAVYAGGDVTATTFKGATQTFTAAGTVSDGITTAFCSNSSGANYTLTMPSASGKTGQILCIVQTAGGINNNVVLSGVNGGSFTLTCTSSVVLVSNGSTWRVASYYDGSAACL